MKFILLLIFSLFQLISSGQKTGADYLVSFSDNSSGKDLYGFKTVKGKINIQPSYIHVSTEKMYSIAFVVLNDHWVAINRSDSILLTPFIFDNGPDYFKEGLFRYVENNKMGFANLKGEKMILPKFDFATPFANGLAAFNVGGHTAKGGEEHSLWEDGLWGFVDKKVKIVIEPKFMRVLNFKNNFAEAITQDQKHVLIDKKGKICKVFKN